MNEEKQQIAIAEACGFTETQFKHIAQRVWKSPKNLLAVFDELPDYLNNLNAMHEAEKVLKCSGEHTRGNTDAYESHLFKIAWRDATFHNDFKAIHATAKQRAEAFLKTLNLWTE